MKKLFVLFVLTSWLIPPPAAAAAAPAAVLRGLDPVLLSEGREVAGAEDLDLLHEGFRYLFASPETRRRFAAEPERYRIQMDGDCPVVPSADGDPDLFAVHEGRIYLFATEGCVEKFHANPEAYLNPKKRNVAILLWNGVELLDFAGPGEVFAAADGFYVYTVAASAEPVLSQGFVTVTPGYTLADSPRPDILVVPGGGTSEALADEALMAWIREAAKEAEVVMSVCTGAFLLARAGLLDGGVATTHHGGLEALAKAAPEAEVRGDLRLADNGKVITAGGVSAGIDAALHVVSRLIGEPAAQATAGYMEYSWLPRHRGEEGERRAAAGAGR